MPTDEQFSSLPHIGRADIRLTTFLGSGAFGEVFQAIISDRIVAIKILRKDASESDKKDFLAEAFLMSHFKHPNVLKLLGVCLDSDRHMIILELMEKGDLLSHLRASRADEDFTLNDKIDICIQVSRGCAYLEKMHFVHRDIAARNCLVSMSNGQRLLVKIGDFGLARDIYKNDYYRKIGEGLLPVRWLAAEALIDGVFTTKSDVWAFGILIWEVMTQGQQPYPGRSNLEVLNFVRDGGRLDRPTDCPNDVYDIMSSCWLDADQRPSFSSLQQLLQEAMQKRNANYLALINEQAEDLTLPAAVPSPAQPHRRSTVWRTLTYIRRSSNYLYSECI